MKAVLTAAILFGAAGSLPALAGEGAIEPSPIQTAPMSSHMTMTPGGIADPFKWSAGPAASQMTVVRGGIADPYRWSASPMPPASSQNVAGNGRTRNPG